MGHIDSVIDDGYPGRQFSRCSQRQPAGHRARELMERLGVSERADCPPDRLPAESPGTIYSPAGFSDTSRSEASPDAGAHLPGDAKSAGDRECERRLTHGR
jgi:hypothetical protein